MNKFKIPLSFRIKKFFKKCKYTIKDVIGAIFIYIGIVCCAVLVMFSVFLLSFLRACFTKWFFALAVAIIIAAFVLK